MNSPACIALINLLNKTELSEDNNKGIMIHLDNHMTGHKSIIRKNVVVTDFTVMGYMTRSHDKIVITNNLITKIAILQPKSIILKSNFRSNVKIMFHTVLSLGLEDRWIDVCSLISLLSPISRKHSLPG